MNLANSLKNLSHHAYGIIGPDTLPEKVRTILHEVHSIFSQANPDFFEESFQLFTIDDARRVKSLHETRPIGTTGKKVFIISMNSVTIEAQNALLKLLEEPAEYAHFFLIIPSTHLLLPAIKSRILVIEGDQTDIVENKQLTEDVQKFLKLSPAKKLDRIKKIVEDISKEKLTRQDAINFLDAVESEVQADGNIKTHLKTLEAISLVRKYIYDRAPSVKMLLEYVALNL